MFLLCFRWREAFSKKIKGDIISRCKYLQIAIKLKMRITLGQKEQI
jgi:hypothetical protein